jgi:N-acetylneuraminic acid mutarotase
LVAGGFQPDTNSYLSSAEIYVPGKGKSDRWVPAAGMNIGRAGHTATVLRDGRVLVTGGFDGTNVLASAEIYDAAANTWTTAGSMNTARWGHTASLLGDGTVLVVGGVDNTGHSLASAEIYDPAGNTWSYASSAPVFARSWHTATLLNDGSGGVLLAGGLDAGGVAQSTVEIYDPLDGFFQVGSLSLRAPATPLH